MFSLFASSPSTGSLRAQHKDFLAAMWQQRLHVQLLNVVLQILQSSHAHKQNVNSTKPSKIKSSHFTEPGILELMMNASSRESKGCQFGKNRRMLILKHRCPGVEDVIARILTLQVYWKY